MKSSLRLRLLLGISATIVTGFAVAAVAIYMFMRASLVEEFDALLASKARALVTLIEQRGSRLEIEFADHPMQEFARQIRPEYYQVWDDNRQVIARSRRLIQGDLAHASGSLAAPGYRFTTLPDGRPGRQVAIQFLPAVEGENLESVPESEGSDDDENRDKFDFSIRRRVTLVVARETAQIDQALHRLSWLLLGVSGSVIVSTLGVMAWLVKRSLSPLDELAIQIAGLDEHELTARFHVDDAPSELEPVVSQLNDLLSRLDKAFQRERIFSADVAHELRTPLAGLRSTVEVAVRKNRGREEYRQSLYECQHICVDMQRLVETLLSLAQFESGRAFVDRSLVDIEMLIMKSWKPHEKKSRERALKVTFEGQPGVFLITDAQKLQVVFANLFSNAVDYAEHGGILETRWTVEQAGLRLRFVNSGCKLSEEQTQRIFDRFWRADSARASTGLHAGLGLALCKRIIQLLGGSILAECHNGRFAATVDFPSEFVSRCDEIDESESQPEKSGPATIKSREGNLQASTLASSALRS